MTDRRFDPTEYHEIWRARLDQAIADFMARRITDTVFEAKLTMRGFSGENLRREFRFHESNRYERERR